jgi:hypothetical protein
MREKEPKMQQYDYRALIEAYIDAQRPPYPHEDFRTFARGLLSALERAFGISISSMDGVRNAECSPLWMLFRAAAFSYVKLSTPRSGFLEDSLITFRLRQLGEQGAKVEAIEREIDELTLANREAHLKLLNTLFVLLWGQVDTVITSDTLRDQGFDDTKRPKWADYYDDM